MTEQERYEIDKDLLNNTECVWDKEKLIGKTEDKETIIKLVTILNKQDKEINQLTKARNKHFQSLIDSEEINEALIKENEELKKENEWLKKEWEYWAEANRQLIKKNNELEYRMDKLKKENEAQKDTIEALTETINDFDIEEV